MLPTPDSVNSVLNALQVDPVVIAQINATLQVSADGLTGARPPLVDSNAFGGSHTGGVRLATNASMAREALTEALTKMSAGLEGHLETLRAYASHTVNIDEVSSVHFTKLTQSTSCVVAPEMNTIEQCAPGGDK